jgi:hypothetical protein
MPDAFKLWRSPRAFQKGHMLSILGVARCAEAKNRTPAEGIAEAFWTPPVMLQRLAAPLSFATAEDGPQYFSRPGCGLATQSICNGAKSGPPTYFVPVARIAPWMAFRAQQASLL